MSFFAMFDWGWLLGAFLIGFGMGWIAVVHRGPVVPRDWKRWLSLLAVILVAVSVSRIVPGRPGYWLDLGLVMFGVYLVGCAIGSWLREFVISRHAAAT